MERLWGHLCFRKIVHSGWGFGRNQGKADGDEKQDLHGDKGELQTVPDLAFAITTSVPIKN